MQNETRINVSKCPFCGQPYEEIVRVKAPCRYCGERHTVSTQTSETRKHFDDHDAQPPTANL